MKHTTFGSFDQTSTERRAFSPKKYIPTHEHREHTIFLIPKKYLSPSKNPTTTKERGRIPHFQRDLPTILEHLPLYTTGQNLSDHTLGNEENSFINFSVFLYHSPQLQLAESLHQLYLLASIIRPCLGS